MNSNGAKWIKESFKIEMSPLGERVANLLDDVFSGIYHINKEVASVDWTNDSYIEMRLGRTLSTYDFSLLSALVFASHDHAIRVEISPMSNRTMQFLFHGRQRGGSGWEHHPKLEEAVSNWRRDSPAIVE